MLRTPEPRLPCLLKLMVTAACFSDPPQGTQLDDSSGDTRAEVSTSDGTTAGSTNATASTDTPVTGGSTTEHADATTETSDADSSASADTGQSSGCAGLAFVPLICTDFDDDASIPPPWTTMESSGAVSVTSSQEAPSPPNVLRSSTTSDGRSVLARISTDVAVVQPSYDVSFDLRFDDTCSIGTVAQISFSGGAESVLDVDLRLSAVSGELIVFNGAGNPEPVPLDAGVIGGADPWRRISIDVTSASGSVQIYVDDVLAGGVSLAPAQPPESPPSIHIGLAHKIDGSCTAFFDDIIVQ